MRSKFFCLLVILGSLAIVGCSGGGEEAGQPSAAEQAANKNPAVGQPVGAGAEVGSPENTEGAVPNTSAAKGAPPTPGVKGGR